MPGAYTICVKTFAVLKKLVILSLFYDLSLYCTVHTAAALRCADLGSQCIHNVIVANFCIIGETSFLGKSYIIQSVNQ